jgi:hypothetical protein
MFSKFFSAFPAINNDSLDVELAIRTDPKSLNVGILGYSGETGKALASEILRNNIFKSTVLIGRRIIDYPQDFYQNAVNSL